MATSVPLLSEEPAAVQAAEDVGMGSDDAVKKRLQVAVQFDTKILDADSRVSRMLDNSMKTLEADGQEWVIHKEGKLMVGIITKAIKPAPLQLAVSKQLQLQRNKVLKSDVFRYVKWLRQFAIGYQLYGGMDDENLRSRWQRSRRRKTRGLVHVSVRSVKKSGSGASVAPPAWRADKRDEPSERPKPKCLKCQSTAHRVGDHPGITDTEVKKLIDDFHQARRRSVNFMSSTSLRTAWSGKKMEIDILIRRPVMERLGFSVDSMLVDAFKQRRVWDMAEAGDADQTSANVNRLQGAFQEVPEDALYAEDVALLTVDWFSKVRQKHMDVLRQALECMHREVLVRSEKLRQQVRGRREKKAHMRLAKFALGDFALLGKIIKFPNKLALNWKCQYCTMYRGSTGNVSQWYNSSFNRLRGRSTMPAG
ncbi:hypothetical protein DYB31_003128 [Aphanomyces astaci]|uniref:Uncharacterized protein n=1 Tax=Aphanomyces astaci TaxID=112090 RepID=A0A397EWW5_APHAT|nr:hypothetical protein DYB31_003128 [Aphanomyces astaci]